MATSLRFVTLDVFTTKRFEGNPLAVVFLEDPRQINQAQKQLIAREFNYSETIFVHPPSAGHHQHNHQQDQQQDQHLRKIDIFTVDQELPFAGHPTIGVTYWFLRLSTKYYAGSTIAPSLPLPLPSGLLTKAGEIPISLVADESEKVAACIPHDVRIHAARMPVKELLRLHAELEPYLDTAAAGPNGDGFPVVSIVKGMTAVHVRLPSLEALGKITTPRGGYLIPATTRARGGYLDEGWDGSGHVAVYFRVHDVWDEKLGREVIRSRMVLGTLEDPATGSACSGMCAYLSLVEGKSAAYRVVQGVEMGRRSEIGVRVEVKEGGEEIEGVELLGSAVKVAEGEISVGDE
ncbi:hypothetical protein PRK78_004851 [Emydomyces testavorans]|uniref:Phenazine biosynthesis protein n=1 Tax=Emydomyces testavorans TaxID=2070801 RepID=A0AAF0IIZ5_9EURO|nr:hypothetical protein PRK78_004851 [Emydomyces testavorans]